jgi:flavorubredoxin
MIRGKCVSSVSGFNATEWPTVFVEVPVAGHKVFKLPTIVGALNTQTQPTVTDSVTSLTVSSVAHRIGVFLGSMGWHLDAYIEVTLS